jgi:hypothetical protein
MRQERLRRWQRPPNGARDLVCIGDSITYDRAMLRTGVRRNWVEQLATRLEDLNGPRPGDGFRGMWRDEWKRTGGWTQIATSDAFDVAPFRQAYLSAGADADRLVWTKPAALTVTAFELYWVQTPGNGDWQFRIDNGDWQNVGPPAPGATAELQRLVVDRPVQVGFEIRAYDGGRPCATAVVGVAPYRAARSVPDAGPDAATGTVVHNLGHANQMLAAFCRESQGDPLAVLDIIRPQLITVLFTNDVRLHDARRFGRDLSRVVERVGSYADVLLIAPFEQRAPRRVDDAETTSGSDVVSSTKAVFLASDVGTRIGGDNIPSGTVVASVQSIDRATMTTAATGSGVGELTIEGRREVEIQAEYRDTTKRLAATLGCAFLDLYDAWSGRVGPGWDAAYAAGLMVDGLHPTQLGHDDIAARVKESLGLA